MDRLHEMGEFRRALVAWLDAHLDELTPANHGHGTLDEHIHQFTKVKRALFDAGFGRYGWPESVGGLGGSPLLRAIVSFNDALSPDDPTSSRIETSQESLDAFRAMVRAPYLASAGSDSALSHGATWSGRPQPSAGWVTVRPPICASFCVFLAWAT